MPELKRTAVLGCGVIGSSWAALFLAGGFDVDAYDPAPGAEQLLITAIENCWPTLNALGFSGAPDFSRLTFHDDAISAVKNADFIQENVPERIDLKHALFAQIEPHLKPGTVISSSASGLMLREMQTGWKNPSRLILGHPFNPPHLIPLVELLANDQTDNDVLPIAEAFYECMGKVTIRVQKEVPAHVANRLQAALWREAISLVENGVASVDDVDKAVWAGPGLRWAAMGPHQLFHLGAGVGGMREFCERYGDSFHRWWDDLGSVELKADVINQLVEGVTQKSTATDNSVQANHIAESTHRDELIVAMLQATRGLRTENKQ